MNDAKRSSVWDIMPGGQGARGPQGSGITASCPKCGARITLRVMEGRQPLRCGKCHYPMILSRDHRRLIEACHQQYRTDQGLDTVVELLRKLSQYAPGAGTELGRLAVGKSRQLTVPEKWSALLSARYSGDDEAQDELDRLCREHPARYMRKTCKNCGAPLYLDKKSPGSVQCLYCLRADGGA